MSLSRTRACPHSTVFPLIPIAINMGLSTLLVIFMKYNNIVPYNAMQSELYWLHILYLFLQFLRGPPNRTSLLLLSCSYHSRSPLYSFRSFSCRIYYCNWTLPVTVIYFHEHSINARAVALFIHPTIHSFIQPTPLTFIIWRLMPPPSSQLII